MIDAKTYAFFNLGRDKKPGTTRRIDRRIVRQIRDAVPSKRCAVFWAEINEGDDNNELDPIREVFKGWRLYGASTHEPIILSPDLPRARQSVSWLKNTAVPHWSPQRSILRVHQDDGETLLGMHFAAGAHTVGDRPDRYKDDLEKSWDISAAAHRKAEFGLHERGRHITWMADVNHYNYPRVGDEVGIIHHRTDYGRAWSARGFQEDFRALPEANIDGLDSHGLLRMRGCHREVQR